MNTKKRQSQQHDMMSTQIFSRLRCFAISSSLLQERTNYLLVYIVSMIFINNILAVDSISYVVGHFPINYFNLKLISYYIVNRSQSLSDKRLL